MGPLSAKEISTSMPCKGVNYVDAIIVNSCYISLQDRLDIAQEKVLSRPSPVNRVSTLDLFN